MPEKYTVYSVLKLTGSSPAGGDPDEIANTLLGNWNLLSEDGNPKNLFKGAVPSEDGRALLKVKIWTDKSIRRWALFFDTEPAVLSLDYGKVLEEKRNGDPKHFDLVVEGAHIFRMRLSCGPVTKIARAKGAVVTDTQADVAPQELVLQPRHQEDIIHVVQSDGQNIIGQILGVSPRLVRPMKDQPRKYFDPVELQDFANNLLEQGQLQPAIVKQLDAPDEDGCLYELIGGERRWRACQIAGIQVFKIIVHKVSTDVDQFEQAVIVNCHNIELSVLETIQSVGRLADLGRTDQQIARIFGKKSTQWASEYRKALSLDAEVLKLLGSETPEEKRLPFSVAKLLIGLPSGEQIKFATMASKSGVSARKVAFAIKGVRESYGIPTRMKPSEELTSISAFFAATNDRVENLVDLSDQRVSALFADKDSETVRRIFQAATDCRDNLNVLLKTLSKFVKRGG